MKSATARKRVAKWYYAALDKDKVFRLQEAIEFSPTSE